MPQPKAQERGIRSPLLVRVGTDIAKLRGTNTQGDPGSIGDDQFQALINVSSDGTRWGSRDGQSKVNSAAAMTGCVYGMWDDDDGLGFGGGPVRVYGGVPSANKFFYAYDSELSTPSQRFKQNPLETTQGESPVLDIHEEFAALRLGAVAGDEIAEENLSTRLIIGGSAGRAYEWIPTSPPEGRTLLDTAAYPKHILTIPGLTTGTVRSLAWWEGVLYLLVTDGSNGAVYAYDGETLALEDTVVGSGPSILGVYVGTILALYGDKVFRVRGTDGVWSTVDMSAVSGAWGSNDIKEYGANAYICGSEGALATILRWDGTDLTVAQTLGEGEGDCYCAHVFNGELVFVWDDEGEGGKEAYIGSYNDSSWTAQEKSILSDLVSGYNTVGLTESKGTLVLGSDDGDGAPLGNLLAIPGTNLAGDYTTLDSGATVRMRANSGGLTTA